VWAVAAALLLAGASVGGSAAVAGAATGPPHPFAVGEKLAYEVRYLGLHCGDMTLETFVGDDADYRIVMTARTTPFFDRIYRVRMRLESWFDPDSGSSIRYRETSYEKDEVSVKEYLLDREGDTVRELEDGEVTETFEVGGGPVHDPLAFLFRARELLGTDGTPVVLNLIGSGKAAPVRVEIVDRKTTSTPSGRKPADVAVPRTTDQLLFSRKGEMQMWLSVDDKRIPYRIEFDLAFGSLKAKLASVGTRPPTETDADRAPTFDE
jgi:hypothetical protein